jgi:hypothetical protein
MPRFRLAIWFDLEGKDADEAEQLAQDIVVRVEDTIDGAFNGTVPDSTDFRLLDPAEYRN